MHVFNSAWEKKQEELKKRSAAAKMIESLFLRYRLRKKFKQFCLEDICNPERKKKLEESKKSNCKKLLMLFLRQKVFDAFSDAFSERKKQSEERKKQSEKKAQPAEK
jgi:hypothetical protein